MHLSRAVALYYPLMKSSCIEISIRLLVHSYNAIMCTYNAYYNNIMWYGWEGLGGQGMGCQWLAGLVSRVCLWKGWNNDCQQWEQYLHINIMRIRKICVPNSTCVDKHAPLNMATCVSRQLARSCINHGTNGWWSHKFSIRSFNSNRNQVTHVLPNSPVHWQNYC